MTLPGIFFFVVGPSGAGKDTLIDGARTCLTDGGRFVFATRTITRADDAPGEAHIGVTEAEFAARDAAGAFLVTWQAHGLHYGLDASLRDVLAQGRHVVANGSRAILPKLIGRVQRLVIVEVSAPVEVLAARIAGRGRETPEQIAARLARTVTAYPAGVPLVRVSNDSTSDVGIARFTAALQACAQPPKSRELADAKRTGVSLNEASWGQLLDDLMYDRYAPDEGEALLRLLIEHIDDDEIVALTRARTRLMPRIDWGRPMVVDKHSMGGVPGSRITLIVVPLVVAYGLCMPKTSSRAITSAAGTADAMEAAARVDLDAAEVRAAVEQAGGCIVWNGRLNHSRVDDVTNAMVRPLRLDTRRWSVASILSKKFCAGSTHVVVDLPWGPQAKMTDEAQARKLGALFERVGAALGMTVQAFATDGRAPIGRGIGPALELRDVLQVLDNDATAPKDLRAKALTFAARILSWHPALGGDLVKAHATAEQLLASGEARRAFERIVDAQGRKDFAMPAASFVDIVAQADGVVASIDGWEVSGIARDAGGPTDMGAGVDLLCATGQSVRAGDALLRVHGNDPQRLAAAAARAQDVSGIVLQ
ncbi:phosphonate metabolism protein/1,5-bisphosphokinase (PRPP-forming) PhnN [Pandoraea norimbergensis]|uniref:Ribose 1,5-bisphosphate phosphokinase PhnN n=1 Tax=Pandoraea norimbergensis TaxID=93219 RepID=A0ABM5WMR7_9BURK|nr:phosphonate metabolism protein/1,5-bisphosphokinase (PRPP-forming) PhnN [Pandoraea norimbergensis]ALS61774.1 phosphonate metabolism protein/1,5-bisphosphokinase (PRPP-forming) PhnN [Pandoraea norimbergensis]